MTKVKDGYAEPQASAEYREAKIGEMPVSSGAHCVAQRVLAGSGRAAGNWCRSRGRSGRFSRDHGVYQGKGECDLLGNDGLLLSHTNRALESGQGHFRTFGFD